MEINKEIYSLTKEILKYRFPNTPQKQDIQITNRGLKIACPYCGDSHIDPTKKRGNLYLNSNTYKCWNDGCFKFTSIAKFLSDFSLKYELDLSDIELNWDTNWNKKKLDLNINEKNPILDYIKDNGDFYKLLDVNYFIANFGLQPMINLPELSTNIIEFIEKRKLRWGNNYHQLVYFDGSYDKLWLLNIHIPTGKVLGLSYRNISHKDFKIYTYLTLQDELGLNLGFEDFENIVTLGNYFNILNVNFQKPVSLTEAQIDGMFINNCISIQGVTKTQYLFDYFDKIKFNLMFDFDKAGLKETLKDGLDGHGFLMWNKMLIDLRKKRMQDAKKIHKIKDINDLYIYINNLYGITVEDFQKLLNKYLTQDVVDLFQL